MFKLFMYIYDTDKFEWFFHKRGNRWKKKLL